MERDTLLFIELETGFHISFVDGSFLLLFLDALSLAQDFSFIATQVLPAPKVLQCSFLLLGGKLVKSFAQELKSA